MARSSPVAVAPAQRDLAGGLDFVGKGEEVADYKEAVLLAPEELFDHGEVLGPAPWHRGEGRMDHRKDPPEQCSLPRAVEKGVLKI